MFLKYPCTNEAVCIKGIIVFLRGRPLIMWGICVGRRKKDFFQGTYGKRITFGQVYPRKISQFCQKKVFRKTGKPENSDHTPPQMINGPGLLQSWKSHGFSGIVLLAVEWVDLQYILHPTASILHFSLGSWPMTVSTDIVWYATPTRQLHVLQKQSKDYPQLGKIR